MPKAPKDSRQPRPQPSQAARFFLRGLITLLPIVLTLVVFGLAYNVVTTYVTRPINRTIYWSLEHNALGWKALDFLEINPYDPLFLDTDALPPHLKDAASRAPLGYQDPAFLAALAEHRDLHAGIFRNFEELAIRPTALRRSVEERVHPLIGVVLSLLLVLWLGWLVGGFVGRRIVTRVDRMFHAIPLVRTVYPYSKQLVEFFFAEKKIDFDTVVAIPYPGYHLHSLAFVTNHALRTIQESVGEEMVTCFVPSSPMPMTGYTLFVRARDIIPLKITVDEALRITMSGGVLIPPAEQGIGGVDLATILRDAERGGRQ
jgi:uncharacterized membrane protein